MAPFKDAKINNFLDNKNKIDVFLISILT